MSRILNLPGQQMKPHLFKLQYIFRELTGLDNLKILEAKQDFENS